VGLNAQNGLASTIKSMTNKKKENLGLLLLAQCSAGERSTGYINQHLLQMASLSKGTPRKKITQW
jgi:hypothetical protein